MKGRKWEILKNIGIAVVCLCVVSYCVFHLSSFFDEEIGTIVVGPTTEKTVTTLSGYVFRDAQLVYPENYDGAVDYLVRDGEKVSAGTKLAVVYAEGGDSSVNDIITVLDEQIDLLQKTTEQRVSVSSITSLRKSASDAYYAIMKQLAAGRDIAFSSEQEKLLVTLNSIAKITDEEFSIKDTLDALVKTRTELLGAGGESETVETEKSGYFYTSVDGYESSFTGEAAQKLDRKGFLSLFESPRASESANKSIGKMSYNSTWYFAAEVDALESAQFLEGQRYTVEFTSGGQFEVRMTVERVLVDEGEKTAVIVLSTNILPDGFNFRRQTAKIVVSSISGIYVPRAAVRREGFERVVYILKGSVVRMRHIDIIYEGSDYYIVRENVEDDEKNYLSSNELLIVKGSKLFDGRILG